MFLLGIEKYRVHEVAKDFGLPTKTITEILTKYAETPKNHMQALTDQELSLIFEYLTQHNPVSSIQVIFADTYKEEPAKEPATKKPEPAGKAAAPAQGQQVRQSVPAQSAQSSQGGRQQPQQQNAASKPAAQQPVSRVPQRKIVDTRKGGDVNLAKYDERLEDLGGERGARMQRQQRSGKEIHTMLVGFDDLINVALTEDVLILSGFKVVGRINEENVIRASSVSATLIRSWHHSIC